MVVGALRSVGSEVLGGKLPVDQVVQERLDVGGPSVLVVEVVGVLPHIDYQQSPTILQQGQNDSSMAAPTGPDGAPPPSGLIECQ